MYEVILHSADGTDMKVDEKLDFNLYYQHYANLTYNSSYSLAVRGINTNQTRLESGIVWHQFTTPTCWNLTKSNNPKCGPDPIDGFTVDFQIVGNHVFNLNVTWNASEHEPSSYSLELRDTYLPHHNEKNQRGVYNYTINKVGHCCIKEITTNNVMAFFLKFVNKNNFLN